MCLYNICSRFSKKINEKASTYKYVKAVETGVHPGVCLAVMTGQVLSIKPNNMSNAVTAGLYCGCFGAGNSISLLTLHSIIMKLQRPCLA